MTEGTVNTSRNCMLMKK